LSEKLVLQAKTKSLDFDLTLHKATKKCQKL